MKYSYEYKEQSVKMYRQGRWPETPEGANAKNFRNMIREWVRIADECGLEALRRRDQNKVWTAEEKYVLVAKVLDGESLKSTAIKAGMNKGHLYNWVKAYKVKGYTGLVAQRKGRPPKEPYMKKKDELTEAMPSEHEEMIRMKARIEYLEAENAALKKESALRYKRWDEQLKAKKQRSSENSAKKDTN